MIMVTDLQGSFSTRIVALGANTNLTGSPALNFAMAGWNVAAAANASGFFTTAFISPGNYLYSTRWGD